MSDVEGKVVAEDRISSKRRQCRSCQRVPSGAVRATLKELRVSKRQYNELRGGHPRTQLDRAVRFLYLNRTCFGGIYRLNQLGEFNVPYGGGARTPSVLWQTGVLLDVASALVDAEICVGDFGVILNAFLVVL